LALVVIAVEPSDRFWDTLVQSHLVPHNKRLELANSRVQIRH
jgi:hypothetical protein